jgi:hypothetical protein
LLLRCFIPSSSSWLASSLLLLLHSFFFFIASSSSLLPLHYFFIFFFIACFFFFFIFPGRSRLITELLDAELAFVARLRALDDAYASPLREQGVLDAQTLDLIFPPVLKTMAERHGAVGALLTGRMQNWKMQGIVGDVYARLMEPGTDLCVRPLYVMALQFPPFH